MTTRKDNGADQGRVGQESRQRTGERPSHLQERPERDDQGQLAGSGGNEPRPLAEPGSRAQRHERTGRGSNLTDEDRARGGEHSAGIQQRDEFGQFAGTRGAAAGGGSQRTEPQAGPPAK